MATISIQPKEGIHQIEVLIEIQFDQSELGKEYLLKGSVKVFEGRTN